jgi:hypothetical protein
MPLVLKSNPQDEDVVIDVIGHIDESAVFPQLKPRLSQRIIMNCAHVTHVNSFASWTWTKWMRAFDEKQQFVFREVTPVVVSIFNVVEDFLPRETIVESLYVPYECANCGHEELFLAVRGRHYVEAMGNQPASLMLPPEINCTKCDGRAKSSVFESKYWKFLGPLKS